jgi:hypothetical protein
MVHIRRKVVHQLALLLPKLVTENTSIKIIVETVFDSQGAELEVIYGIPFNNTRVYFVFITGNLP